MTLTAGCSLPMRWKWNCPSSVSYTHLLKDYYAKTGKLRIGEGQDEVEHTAALTLKAVED